MLKRGVGLSDEGLIVLKSLRHAKRFVRDLKHVKGKLIRGSTKGSNGRVLIIGGSTNLVGCLALAARAAFAVGVDVVTIATVEKAAWILNAVDPSFITVKLSGNDFSIKHFKTLEQLMIRHDAVLIGNGWNVNNTNKALLHKLLKIDSNAKFVLDAGAIRMIDTPILNTNIGSRLVLTPHAKEFESLFNTSLPNELSNRVLIAQRFCGNTVLLLKGVVDVVVNNSRVGLNHTGCDALTVAGSGDVLAGMVTGLMARGISRFESALLAAFINGFAGESLSKEQRYFTAIDLVNNLPIVVKNIGL